MCSRVSRPCGSARAAGLARRRADAEPHRPRERPTAARRRAERAGRPLAPNLCFIPRCSNDVAAAGMPTLAPSTSSRRGARASATADCGVVRSAGTNTSICTILTRSRSPTAEAATPRTWSGASRAKPCASPSSTSRPSWPCAGTSPSRNGSCSAMWIASPTCRHGGTRLGSDAAPAVCNPADSGLRGRRAVRDVDRQAVLSSAATASRASDRLRDGLADQAAQQ